ncbi:MAG: right-handed parallel beta-helix repeat-containing protein [Lentimicrobium sp.]|uniref:right-handed parallel beta-helix repeat-containing protein n=1 Tax=Lentimicrobium sp. TaxID=2034841 RepID=UPI0025CD04FD|nr:right-handed parallel beta-helix repeat-containing protein [Lentimicrobium sp.]MCO5256894.1 right-handed parallel beta-helix repeat-containing protein [Lentimicrobium sp.]
MLKVPAFRVNSSGKQIITISETGNGTFAQSFTLDAKAGLGMKAGAQSLFAENTGGLMYGPMSGEVITTVPVLQPNTPNPPKSTICSGGFVYVTISGATNMHTYRLQQTTPSSSTFYDVTANGTVVNFPGVNPTAYATWTITDRDNSFSTNIVIDVVPQPSAPVLTKSPTSDAVCSGTDVSATILTNGSGGIMACVDSYQYSTDGGVSWLPYNQGDAISTTGFTSVDIRALRSDNTGAGCSSENIYSWTVNALPVPAINGPTDVCANSMFTYTTESGMTDYTWTIVGGSGSSSGNSIDVTWDNIPSGTHSVSVTYKLNDCQAASPTVLNVTVTGTVQNTSTGVWYCSIKDAISNAGIDNTIVVSAGNYFESDIIIDKDGLTMTGAGKTSTFIKPDPTKVDDHACSPTGGVVHHGIIIKAQNVTINNLTIDGGATWQYRMGITSSYWNGGPYNNTHIENVNVNNVWYRGIVLRMNGALTSGHDVINCHVEGSGSTCGDYQSWAILGFNANDIEIKDCTVTGFEQGIATGNYLGTPTACDIQGNNVTNVVSQAYTLTHNGAGSTFTDNIATFTNSSNEGIGLVTYQDEMTLTNNTFIGGQIGISVGYQTLTKDKLVIGEGNVITGPGKTISGSIGVQATDDGWPGAARNFIMTGTSVSGFETGIWINPLNGMTCNADINGNKIFDNGYGLKNDFTSPVNAENNWWGDATGPYNNPYNTCGLGNAVEGNISFVPWLDASEGNPVPYLVWNQTQNTYFCKIQEAIDHINTQAGDLILIGEGTYYENVNANKRVTLQGTGSTSTIINGSGGIVLQLTAGVNAVTRMVVKDLKVTGGVTGLTAGSYTTIDNVISTGNSSYGINLNPLTDLVLTNSSFNANNVGLKLASTASASNISITGCHFDNNQQGWYSDASSTIEPDLDQVSIVNTTFDDNVLKGFYTERLSNATFDGITVDNSGSSSYAWGAGIDINLKWKGYSNIEVKNSTLSNCGIGSANGVGITIKARNDGTSYGANPATLSGVTIDNVEFDSNRTGLAFGEPTKDNDGPTSLVIKNSTFKSNTVMDINNFCKSDIDAKLNNTFTGAVDNFAIEDRVYHKLDNSVLGLVTWLDENVYVTANSGSIQRGIVAASPNWNVNVNSGTFNETVSLDKKVSLVGAGSTLAGTIITKTGGNDGAINLVASGVSGDPILVKDIRIEPIGAAGISVGTFTPGTGTNVSWIKLENVKVIGTNASPCTEQERGLYVDLTSSLTNLEIVNCAFDNLHYGWYFQKQVSADASTVSNVSVTGTSFTHNSWKGIYTEKLSEATFTNCTIDQNGVYDASTTTGCGYFMPWMSGFDINLKAGTYQNLTFTGCSFTNNGLGTNGGVGTAKEGVGLAVKARSDASSYNVFPATLTRVTVTGCTFTGNERGMRFGEPGKNNPQPLNVAVHNNSITGNVKTYPGTDGSPYGGIVNVTTAGVDATCNWWGTTDPLVIETSAEGDIEFLPFLISATGPCDGVGPVVNVTQGLSYMNIQPAIDEANSGDEITVAAGTYVLTSQLRINKSITLEGAGIGQTIITRGTEWSPTAGDLGIAHLIGIGANNVSLSNLTVSGAQKVGTANGSGINVYVATGVVFSNVESKDNQAAGFIINGSSATMTDVQTSGNGWYAVNVARGSGVTQMPDLTVNTSSFGEAVEIMADADIPEANVTYNYQYVFVGGEIAYNIKPFDLSSLAHASILRGGVTYIYTSINSAIAAANAGETVIVSAGTFAENIVANKSIVLEGANAGITCGSRVAESILAPASGVPVVISADGVTINGFEITTGGNVDRAIVCSGKSDVVVEFNNIHDVGAMVSGSNVYGFIYSLGSATAHDVSVLNNCFDNIGNSNNHQKSNGAIGFLDSGATGTLTTVNIENNLITDVFAKTADWSSGGRIAYGIIFNIGSSGYTTSTGNVIDAVIQNNEISNLSGFISTGIGLEGNTEDAVVKNNSVAYLSGTKTDLSTGGAGYDLNGLKFETNRYVSTCTVQNNSFQTDTYTHSAGTGLGYAVVNYVPSDIGGEATLNCNWYGTAVYNDIVQNGLAGKILNKTGCVTNFAPYLTADTDDQPTVIGFQPPAGTCAPCALVIEATSTTANCPARNNGTATVEVTSGGNSPSYLWTPGGQTTATATGLTAGTYTVTATNIDGCTATASVDVLNDVGPIVNTNTSVTYCSIQEAINAATPGDELMVNVASYSEGPQIVVNRNITLLGMDLNSASTTLLANGNTGASGDARGWILVNPGVEFNLKNITLDGNGNNIMQAVRHNGTGTIDNVFFNDISYPGYNGIAVVAFGNLKVQNSQFTDIGRVGIIFFGTGCSNGQAIGNTYTGKGVGDQLDYAIEVGGGAIASVSDCIISNNKGIASTDGSTSAGIIATTYYGAGTTANITGCTLTDNTTGINVGYDNTDVSVVVANNNKIYSNREYGIFSTGPAVDGTNNWWGDASGPYNDPYNTCGLGNAVAGLVDFMPWWTTSSGTPSTDMLVHNVTLGTYYCTIQDAIDDAGTGGETIEVGTATFSEHILINKTGLILKNAASATPIISGSGTGIVVTIAASNVTLDGFAIRNSGLTPLDAGIIIGANTGCTVQNNTVTACASGIGIQGGHDNFVTSNTVSENAYYGVAVIAGTGNTINQNNISVNGLDAIALDNASAGGGPVTVGSTGNFILDNTISSARDGIFLGENCSGNQISGGNNITGTTTGSVGINLWRSGSQTITGNTIQSFITGIRLLGSSGNTITGNTLTSNTNGFKVDPSWQVGVWYQSLNNNISLNNISGNTTYGMLVGDLVNQTTPVDATQNWWGSNTGPTYSDNPCGTGDAISANVLYNPWRNEALDTDIYQLEAFSLSDNSSICAGGTADITLSGSQTGVQYDLYKDGTLVSGESKTGTGNPLTWTVSIGLNATYTVKATNQSNGCTLDMTGSTRIFVGPITTIGSLTDACVGSQVEVPVTVISFEEVGYIALTINYNPSVLQYTGYTKNPDLMTNFSASLVEPGIIKVVGFIPETGSPISLSNGSTLFTPAFTYLGGTTTLAFDDTDAAWCQYGSGTPYFVDFCDTPNSTYYKDGSVSGNPRPTVAVSGTTTICNGQSTSVSFDLTGTAPWVLTYTINGVEQPPVTTSDDPYVLTVNPIANTTYLATALTDANCASWAGDITGSAVVTVNPTPVVNSASMLSSTDQTSWVAVSGDLSSGYDICIDADNDYYYLDIAALSSTPTMGSTGFVQNAFYLDKTSVPAGFYTYWAAQGVVSGATGWQGIMWNIINGTAPMFYINYTGTDYQLIDGLQYQIGSGANALRVSGDYPQGSYTFQGTVTDVNGCVSAPFNVSMLFNTIPHMNPVADQTYCNGATAPLTSLSSTVSGSTFTWTNSNTAIGLAASGSGDILSFTATNTSNSPVTAIISVTPTAPSACAGNEVALYTITVYPTPSVYTVSDAVYCNGTAGDAISFGSPTTGGTITYNWTSTANVGFGTSGTGDIPTYTASNSGSSELVATISVTATVNGCTGPATTFTVTVNPTPVVASASMLSSTDNTNWSTVNGNLVDGYDLCINSDFNYYYLDINALSSSTAMSNTGFEQNAFSLNGTYPQSFFDYWAAKGVVSGATGWQGIMWNIINGTAPMFYINYTGTDYQLIDGLQYQAGSGANPLRVSGDYPQGSYTFLGTVTDVNGCVSDPFNVVMDFNTIPHMNPVANQSYCNGETAPLTSLSATVSGSTFTWTNSNTTIGLVEDGIGDVPSFTATNTTNSPVTATISVTPTAPSACAGNEVALYTITVYPTPSVYTVSDAVYCNGTAGDAISFGSPTTGGTITYNWTCSSNIGFGISGTGNIPAYTASNSGSSAIVATVSVTASVNGCTGSATTFTVTVNPTPVATASVTTPIPCNGSTATVTITPTVGTAPFTFYFGSETPNSTGIFTGIGAGTYSWSITDANTCNSATGSLIVSEPAAITVSGTVTYYNPANTIMNNVSVILRQGSTDVHTTTTDGSGHYALTNVCPGTYDVILSTNKSKGGINSGDAAQVNAWGVNLYSIEKVRFFAGDVAGGDNQLLAPDAGRILQYFLTNGNPPFATNWTFWKTDDPTTTQNPLPNVLTLTVNPGSSPITQNFYALVTGDFNMSFVPGGAKSMMDNVMLNIGGTTLVEPDVEFELPLTVGMDLEVAAVSLIIDFPADNLEVTGVYLGTDPESPVDFNFVGNELRIGWHSLFPMSLATGETLLTLRLRTTGNLAQGEIIRLSLTSDPLNELADGNYNTIPNAQLFVDEIGGIATGVSDITFSNKLSLECYPNPFVDKTTFAYTLPREGKVVLEMADMLGSKTDILLDALHAAGSHTLTVDMSSYSVGIYTATLRLHTGNDVISRTIKVIRRK